jgi:hypothetical protein
MQRRIITIVSLGILAVPVAARADSFGEVVAGVAIPLGDEDYSDVVDESFKLGLRGGTLPTGGIGLEGGIDWTAINDDIGGEVFGQSFDVAWNRFRILAGARVGKITGGDTPVYVFGRAAAGVDLVHVSVTAEVLGVESEDSETDAGLALEVGGGALVSIGSVALGAQVAVPMGFHFEDDDGDDSTIDHDYTSYDLDILATVATSF